MWPFKSKKKEKVKIDADRAVKTVLLYPNGTFEGRVATAFGMVKKRNPKMSDVWILMAVAESFNGK